MKIDDVAGETAAAAYDRALRGRRPPWLATGHADGDPRLRGPRRLRTTKARKERQLMLRALMLAGPDGQVM